MQAGVKDRVRRQVANASGGVREGEGEGGE